MKATIKANQTLTARSIGDYNCIFKLTVLSRKGQFCTIKYMGNEKRTKVYTDGSGNEYIQPDKYSMAPIFRAQ